MTGNCVFHTVLLSAIFLQPKTSGDLRRVNEDGIPSVDGREKLSDISANDNNAVAKMRPKNSNRRSEVSFFYLIRLYRYSEVSVA